MRLAGMRTYLAGAMDRVADGGVGWRNRISPLLKAMGVTVLNPCDKPVEVGIEDSETRGEIEKLKYVSRLPEHATLFKNKAILSKMLWDVHFYNTKKFYKECNQISDQAPSLEKNGYITGELNQKDSLLLKEIFLS